METIITTSVIPEINAQKCHDCERCVDVCPNNVLLAVPAKKTFLRRQKSKVLVANPQKCAGCNACVVSCPHHAISLWQVES